MIRNEGAHCWSLARNVVTENRARGTRTQYKEP